MNKLMTAGLVALGLVLTSQQEAPAWVNFKGGIGLNVEFSSGNNCFGWGLISNGQVPGANCYAPPMDYFQPMGFDGPPAFQPGYYGAPAPQYGHFAPPVAPQFVPPAPQPGWTPPAPQPAGSGVNYPRQSVQPAHYYPTSYYGGSNYPVYWYGQ